jgi:hypothetical protein
MSSPTEPTQWRRSSFCASGSCVEVGTDGAWILVRDSKTPGTAPLRFDAGEFSAFLDGVRSGEFDEFAGGAPN